MVALRRCSIQLNSRLERVAHPPPRFSFVPLMRQLIVVKSSCLVDGLPICRIVDRHHILIRLIQQCVIMPLSAMAMITSRLMDGVGAGLSCMVFGFRAFDFTLTHGTLLCS